MPTRACELCGGEYVESRDGWQRCGDCREMTKLASHASTTLQYMTLCEARRRLDRLYLLMRLRQHRGSVTKAAEAAGLSRKSFYAVARHAGLDPTLVREAINTRRRAKT